jgi:hypothetical protein
MKHTPLTTTPGHGFSPGGATVVVVVVDDDVVDDDEVDDDVVDDDVVDDVDVGVGCGMHCRRARRCRQ